MPAGNFKLRALNEGAAELETWKWTKDRDRDGASASAAASILGREGKRILTLKASLRILAAPQVSPADTVTP